MPLISDKLKEVLVCPADRASLSIDEKAKALRCEKCGRSYPVRDGIPVMISNDPRTESIRTPDKGGEGQ